MEVLPTLETLATTMSIDQTSLDAITSPNWLDTLDYLTTLVVLGGASTALLLRWLWRRKIPADVDAFQYTLAPTGEVRTILSQLGSLSIRLGYGRYADIGRLIQLVPDRLVRYGDYKSGILSTGIVSEEWFERVWGEWFDSDDIVLSTNSLYLIQTTILAQHLRRLPLTIIQRYYSILFDWLQVGDYCEDSKFMHEATLDKLLQQLKLVGISSKELRALKLIHTSHSSTDSNHKYYLWQQLSNSLGGNS